MTDVILSGSALEAVGYLYAIFFIANDDQLVIMCEGSAALRRGESPPAGYLELRSGLVELGKKMALERAEES